jgi:hypothetical protein
MATSFRTHSRPRQIGPGTRFTPAEAEAVKDDITILLIGDVAEARLHGSAHRFDANDPQTSDEKEIVGRMTALWPAYATADAEVAALEARARKIVATRWRSIDRVATALLRRNTLSGEDVRALMRSLPFRVLARWTTREDRA